MAILRASNGKFYEIPDELLPQYEVPAGLVRLVAAALAEQQGGMGPGPMGPLGPGGMGGMGGPQGPGGMGGPEGPVGMGGPDDDVQPYGWGCDHGWGPWRNRWRNCY